MLPTSTARAPGTFPTGGAPTAQALAAPGQHPAHPDAVAPANDVVATLRGGGVIEGRMLHLVLSLLPTLDGWTRGQQIALHAGDGTIQLYGTTDDAVGHTDPIHVLRAPDGHFAAGVDGGWQDRGATPNSPLDAVLMGMLWRNALEHYVFTAAGPGEDRSVTDAQRVRERVAAQLQSGHPASMRVLEAISQAEAPEPHRRRLPSTGAPPQAKPLNAGTLLEISQMSADEILRAGGLVELVDAVAEEEALRGHADHATPDYRARRANDANVHHNPITAPLLREMLKERCAPFPRNIGELAEAGGHSFSYLKDLMYRFHLPKAQGVDLLWRGVTSAPRPFESLRTCCG